MLRLDISCWKAGLLFSLLSIPMLAQTDEFVVYVGTYGKGVFAYQFEGGSDNLKSLGLVGQETNPSWLAIDPNDRHLYAVSELEGQVDGAVAAFSINRTSGAMQALNSHSSDGQAPCYVSVDKSGSIVMVANYGTGQVAVFPIAPNGSLGKMSQSLTARGSSVNPQRQQGPHAHEAVPSPDNRFVYVPDLGLDQIRIYKLNAAAQKLIPNEPPYVKLTPGNGPRHIALTQDGRFAYVVNELRSVVTVFSRDIATGALKQTQEVSTLPGGFTGDNAPAEILLDSSERFVYASNRGPGSIAVFARNPRTGSLSQIQVADTGGPWPRGVALDPSGKFMFVGDQKSNQFVLLKVDRATGKLTRTGKVFNVSSPVAFVFVPISH